MSRRWVLALALLALGCAQTKAKGPASAYETRASNLQEQFTKRARLDPHTQLRVTHWHRDLMRSEGLWAQTRPEDQRELAMDRMRRWEQGAKDIERFVLLIEVKDADAQEKDPRLDLGAWSFSLEQGGARSKPQSVQVLSKARYPTQSGGAHWRIGARIDFAKPSRSGVMTLRVLAPDEQVVPHGQRTLLPQLPARFEFAADSAPATPPAPQRPASLTADQATK